MPVDASIPGPTVGVIGGGQLGRMLGEAAAPLGIELHVLDPTPNCPASVVASEHIVADFDDTAAVATLADRVDILTLEIELADPTALAEASAPVEPAPNTLATIQDKLEQMRTLEAAGIPLPRFRAVDDQADLLAARDDLGLPLMLKARTGGYDGRGTLALRDENDLEEALETIEPPAMVEEFVAFERELAVMVAQGADERRCHPVTETIHEAEILRETVVPAGCSRAVADRARAVATDVVAALEGRGIFGVELFETTDGEVLFNEVAPRPHNSGHWTIEGAVTSQFEQHLRAVLGWPLGDTDRRSGAVVTKNLLGDDGPTRPAGLTDIRPILEASDVHLHWYGKDELRPLRKLGHLTAVGDAPDSTRDRVRKCHRAVSFR